MAGITAAQAQAQLDAWLAASLAVAQNQEYVIAGRKLTRADAAEVRRMIDYWQGIINNYAARNRSRVRYVVPG